MLREAAYLVNRSESLESYVSACSIRRGRLSDEKFMLPVHSDSRNQLKAEA